MRSVTLTYKASVKPYGCRPMACQIVKMATGMDIKPKHGLCNGVGCVMFNFEYCNISPFRIAIRLHFKQMLEWLASKNRNGGHSDSAQGRNGYRICSSVTI